VKRVGCTKFSSAYFKADNVPSARDGTYESLRFSKFRTCFKLRVGVCLLQAQVLYFLTCGSETGTKMWVRGGGVGA